MFRVKLVPTTRLANASCIGALLPTLAQIAKIKHVEVTAEDDTVTLDTVGAIKTVPEIGAVASTPSCVSCISAVRISPAVIGAMAGMLVVHRSDADRYAVSAHDVEVIYSTTHRLQPDDSLTGCRYCGRRSTRRDQTKSVTQEQVLEG